MRRLLLGSVLAATLGAAPAEAQIVTQPDIILITPAPTPGSVVIRLGGRIDFFAAAIAETGNTAPGARLAHTTFGDYVRLYPSIDGVTANGLHYGAFAELRSEQYRAAGGGSQGTIADANASRGAIFARREYLYFGTEALGTIRLGSTDSASGLFETGTFENFNEGGWNGDSYRLLTTAAAPVWPFAINANIYTTTKAAYLSPQFGAFDFGVSFEPNTGGVSDYGGTCLYASSGCDRLSASAVPDDLRRRRSTIDAVLRYRGVFSSVGVASTAGFIASDHVQPLAGAAPNYEGLRLGDVGTAVTIGGIVVGGHVTYGRGNGAGYALEQAGASPELAYITGATYTLGPLVVGGSIFQTQVAGLSGPAADPSIGQLRERGVAAGGTFSLAPGVSVFLDYLYGDRRENGVNLLGDSANQASHNQTKAQSVGVGWQIRW